MAMKPMLRDPEEVSDRRVAHVILDDIVWYAQTVGQEIEWTRDPRKASLLKHRDQRTVSEGYDNVVFATATEHDKNVKELMKA